MSVETVQRSTPARTLPAAALCVVVAAAMSFYGAYGDPHSQASQEHTVPYVVGADIVVGALIFGLLLPWAARRNGRSAGWGLALGILALVTMPMTFWSGINVILAGAGVLLGMHAKPARLGRAAVIVGLIAIVLSLALLILGNTVLA